MACIGVLTVCACGTDDGDSQPNSSTQTAPASSSAASNATSPPTSSSPAPYSPAPYSPAPYSQTPQPPTLPPPYIEGADWVETDVGPSLQIRPTRSGRDVSGDVAGGQAWSEVLEMYPNADTPGMRAQFDCHWTFARLVEPDKPSWNIEPRRPVVTESEMISARCNPGFAEEG